jgi:hypothetical protein
MTAAALTPSKEYIENGVTLAYAVPFRFKAPTHIKAQRIAADGTVTELVYGSNYSVVGGETDAGGTLTVTVAGVAGTRLRIRRVTPRAQDMDYTTGDTFPAESHEGAIDRAMLIDQEQDQKIDDTATRALLVPDGQAAPAMDLDGLTEGDILQYRGGKLQRLDKSAFAGKFYAGDASGAMTPASGLAGADSALRTDLATVGMPLVAYITPLGATLRTGREKLAERLTPEDRGAVGNGIANDTAAFVAAANEAVARGVYLRGRRGATYLLGSAANLPAGLHFDGEGCTIKANSDIEMLVMLGGGWRIYNCKIVGPDGGVYTAGNKGIVCHGDDESRGAGIAPNYYEDVVIEGVDFVGIGNTCFDPWFVRGIRARDLSFKRVGYGGAILYSCEDFDGRIFNADTLTGETTSGEMNAYVISFTSKIGSVDAVRDPPSRRCYAHDGLVVNMPTWHALDTHGGRICGFEGWEMRDVRRAVALTNRGTDSAQDCYARKIRSFNTLPFALQVSGEPTVDSINAGVVGATAAKLKKDSGMWVTGVSASPARNIELRDIYLEGHGRPGQLDGSFYFEHCDLDARGLADKDGYINGIYAPNGVTGRIEHRSLNLVAWDNDAYPGGSFGQLAFDTVRPIDMRGGNLAYEGRQERTVALPANTFALDALIASAGAGNQIKLIGNGVKNSGGSGLFISGDENYVTGNYTRGVSVTAGAGQFTGVAPSGSVMCTRDADSIALEIPAISGTADPGSTAFTLGTLPVNFRPSRTQTFTIRGTDNSVAIVVILTIATSGVMTLATGLAGGAWTASGTKGVLPETVRFTL